MPSYPEHIKLQAVRDKSQEIGNFLEWIEEQGCTFGDFRRKFKGPWPECVLSKYFDIDLNKLENEKCQMLEEIRSNPNGRSNLT